MIRKSEPLSMPECLEYLDKKEEKEKELIGFIKKFTKLNTKDAKEMKKKIEDLDLMQIRDEHVIKIIDSTPANSVDLSKILVGVSLDEDETKKILEIVKEYN